MSPAGDAELLVAARAALLDALDALAEQRDALVLIGAQAVYLHTGGADIALAEATKDSDLAVDPRALVDDPLGQRSTSPAQRRCWSPSSTSSASDATTPPVSSTRTPTTSTASWSPYRRGARGKGSPPFARTRLPGP
jgi:hypothetical protein